MSFLRETIDNIGQERDQNEINSAHATVRKRKFNDLSTDQRSYLQRNTSARIDEVPNPGKDFRRVERQQNKEIIQLEGEADDIDVLYEYKDFDGTINLYNKLV